MIMNNDETTTTNIKQTTNEHYRRVLATANKLETLQSNLDSVIDFFLAPIVKLRSRLCNDCSKLFFNNSNEFKINQFRKAEELIWRRIYYDIYKFHKTIRQQKIKLKKQDELLIESHFISGIGFYSSLIIKLRYHFDLKHVQGIIEPLNLSLGPLDNFVSDCRLNATKTIASNNDKIEEAATTTIDDDNNSMSMDDDATSKSNDANKILAKEWACLAIYRSLVYMGDLARYLLECSQVDYKKLAFQFYCSASRSQPDYGLPLNQLATLTDGSNHNLDAVCNYMRCCLKTKPFEGAEGNMKKLFELNKEAYEADVRKGNYVSKVSDVLASKNPSKDAESMIRAVIITFIKLTSELWLSAFNLEQLNKELIVRETHFFFELFRECLELEPIVPLATEEIYLDEFCPLLGGLNCLEKPRYLSSNIIYEFCSISIMLMAKCQKCKPASNETSNNNHNNNNNNNNQTESSIDNCLIDLVNTLALNLLHYTTSKCQKVITNKLREVRVLRLFTTNTDKFNSSSDGATGKRMRQKQAASNYSPNIVGSKLMKTATSTIPRNNEDSDMSELEETALSTIDALEISSEMSDDYEANDLIDLDSSNDEVSLTMASNQSSCLNRSTNSLINFNNSHTSKPALRPTKSQNYEIERSINLATNNNTISSSSVAPPDLLTGDVSLTDEQTNHKTKSTTSQSSLNSIGRTSPINFDKGSQSFVNDGDDEDDDDINEFDAAMAFIYNQTYSPTIKIFCDWLLANGDIISLNLPSFRSFHVDLEALLTSLKDLRKVVETSLRETQIYTHNFDGPTWIQKYPLSCDFPLMNLSPLKKVHELNIDFTYQRDLEDSEAGFITIQCIEAFFHALSCFLENKIFQ